jgi:hypothetical protein
MHTSILAAESDTMHRLALDAKIIPQLVAALEGDATGYSCQRLAFFIYLRSQIHAREHN